MSPVPLRRRLRLGLAGCLPVIIFYSFSLVSAADPLTALSPRSGNGFLEIAALANLIGSSTAESLALGNRRAAGLPWAALSSFGIISVIRACVTGASPGWLRETLGARNSVSDLALGMTLELEWGLRGAAKARRDAGGVVGIICKNRVKKSSQSPEKRADVSEAIWEDVYAFNQQAVTILYSVPESQFGKPTKVFTFATYSHIPEMHMLHDWLALSTSLLKLTEIYALYVVEKHYLLALVSSASWFYFLLAALALQFLRSLLPRAFRESDSGKIDILAGQLPTTKRPGEERKIFLGAPESERESLPWKIMWILGSVITTMSLLATYLLLGRAKDRTLYTWAGFQTFWLILRILFYHFAEVAEPMAHRMVTDRPWKVMTTSMKERVLSLTLALAKYQIHIHPRGSYSYPEDMISTSKLVSIFNDINFGFHLEFPLEASAQPGDSIDLSMVEVIGDTVLASSAWMVGSNLTGLDLYDSCLIVVDVRGTYMAIPAARVLSGLSAPKIDIESSAMTEIIPKGSTNLGQTNLLFWYYWVPCGRGLWLQLKTEDKSLTILGTRQAQVLSDAQVTEVLVKGDLNISLTSVEEVKSIVKMSLDAGVDLLDLWILGERGSSNHR